MVVPKLSPRSRRLRWLAFSVFVLASSLNYLDRFLLNQLAPLILDDLHLTRQTFGWILSASALVYALGAPLAGWLLDRWGVNRSMTLAVGWWSLAGIWTAAVQSIPALTLARGALALGESAGIPAVSKVNGLYLEPGERALGTAVNGVGLSVGIASAALWVGLAKTHGWRAPFVLTGLLSLLWIPLWLFVSRAIPPRAPETRGATSSSFALLRERPLLLLVLANLFWMGSYSFWTNWLTLYFTGVYHLSLIDSARYTWIPPLISNIGGFFGGWLSLRAIRNGAAPVPARTRAVWISAIASLVTLLLPWTATPAFATLVISAGFFFALAGSVNIYALAIDVYGSRDAGFAVAAMTCAYGLLQAAISPYIGALADRNLYNQAVWLVTVPLLLSAFCLNGLQVPNRSENAR